MKPEHNIRQRRRWPSISGSAEQRASRGLARLEDLTRIISEWVWEVNLESEIVFASDRVNEVLGMLPLQLYGKTFSEIGQFIDDNGTEIEPNWNKPFRDVLFEMQDSSGADKLFLISSVPLYNEKTWGYEGASGMAEDITERRQNDQTLRDALAKAEMANIAKSEFLATMSHEIRTPLTSIKGSVGLLRGFMSQNLSHEGLELLEISSRNIDSLMLLINDMLDYEKTLSGMMTVEMAPFEMGALTKSVVDMNQGYANSKGVRFVYNQAESLIWANINEHRFAQVMRNLLSNAAKFSGKGEDVSISVSQTDGHVRINVEDFGQGIAQEDQGKIFDRFVQVDSSDARQYSGSGLGLAICQALTEAMNGTVGFTSALGVGSVFYVDFPIIPKTDS